MTECKRIARTLESVGFSPDGIECNEDGFKMRGETGEGKVMICVMDLALKMPKPINTGDPRDIIAYIENRQREYLRNGIDALESLIKTYKDAFPNDVSNSLFEILNELG